MDFTNSGDSSQDEARRKAAILSVEELFHWRKKEVLPVPQRGGVKDFEPDGSWLQDKTLQSFYEELKTVLAEPRVEKSGNLVKGTWDSEKKLVNIEKTAKFWMKMGFAQNDRNWLHPEEALFLMEVNCLDVVHDGISLSLQEAYGLLLHPANSVSEEEYQVFAHLRRLGYIVLRHAGKLDVTPYEMKIGLHNYTKKKSKKHLMKSRNTQNQSPETKQQMDLPPTGAGHLQEDNACKSCYAGNKVSEDHCTLEKSNAASTSISIAPASSASTGCTQDEKQSGNVVDSEQCQRLCESRRGDNQEHIAYCDDRQTDRTNFDRFFKDSHRGSEAAGSSATTHTGLERTDSINDRVSTDSINDRVSTDSINDRVSTDSGSLEPPKKKARMESVCETSSSALSAEQQAWCDAAHKSLSTHSCLPFTQWDFGSLHFPDMGGRNTVLLCIPPAHCLPPNTCMEEEYEDVCMFDVEQYRQQQCLSSTMDHEDNSRHLRQLEFSYAEWHKKNFRPLTARNWREWKEEFGRRQKSFLLDSPVAHLWQGSVTPVLQPMHAQSTDSLLQRLSVIQPLQGPFLGNKESHEAVKITYDVYMPNTTFKKSCPGLPDHRVCVARGTRPPNVFEMHAATAHLNDSVPLHWAVVSSGDICFFVFEDLDLPVHRSTLG